MERLGMQDLFFLFLIQNIDCGYSLELTHQGGTNPVPTINVLSKIIKNMNFQFLL